MSDSKTCVPSLCHTVPSDRTVRSGLLSLKRFCLGFGGSIDVQNWKALSYNHLGGLPSLLAQPLIDLTEYV